jgi:hypothetical protein
MSTGHPVCKVFCSTDFIFCHLVLRHKAVWDPVLLDIVPKCSFQYAPETGRSIRFVSVSFGSTQCDLTSN